MVSTATDKSRGPTILSFWLPAMILILGVVSSWVWAGRTLVLRPTLSPAWLAAVALPAIPAVVILLTYWSDRRAKISITAICEQHDLGKPTITRFKTHYRVELSVRGQRRRFKCRVVGRRVHWLSDDPTTEPPVASKTDA